MSEIFSTSVEGYTELPADRIGQEAGLLSSLGQSLAGGMAGIASIRDRFLETVEERSAELRALEGGPPGAPTEDVRDSGRTALASQGSRLQAMVGALENARFGLLRAAVEREAPGLLDRMSTQDTAWAKAAADRGHAPTATRDAEVERLSEILTRATERLQRAEAAVLSRAVAGSLEEMGYTVEASPDDGGGRVALRGSSGQGPGVFVLIDTRRGHVHGDFVGFSGTECHEERRLFLEALARQGVRLRLLGADPHGCTRGGALASRLDALSRGTGASSDHAWASRARPTIRSGGTSR